MSNTTEQWGLLDIELQGPDNGNPFAEVELNATFRHGETAMTVPGFYDGEGTYRVRFMPPEQGEWTFRTTSNAAELDGQTGILECAAPSDDNHGPVHVRNKFHFAYADGTPFFPFGTTCYAWAHQGDELEAQTLETLKSAGFNKLRMCVFPKDYIFNKNEPVHHPFDKNSDGGWDFSRYNIEFFRHFEKRVAQLGELGIEADIILFHPYDRWGYATMAQEEDYAYLRYVVARLAAYRHVWWSMANEYDFMLKEKPMHVWDRFFEIVRENDPYNHLRSIHNGRFEDSYDHTKDDVTHACVQHWDVKRMREWREMYGKPVIDDECEYEGNVVKNWGNISARELVHRFWISVCYGGYAGHGETYEHEDDILWWSKGGVLHGESASRIAFLRGIVAESAPDGIEPLEGEFPWDRTAAGQCGDTLFIYFGEHQPKHFVDGLPKEGRYKVDLIDTWNMTIETLDETFEGQTPIELPGRPFIAMRVRMVE
jgi:hypothetical protein